MFAREIRERFEYTFTPIVMVTAIGNMEMQAYRELHCYQYIMKPFHREQVEEVVQKVLEKESREKPPVIVVKKDGINYQLKCEDIRYLEAIPRGTRLHLVTENWDVPYVTLRQMLLKMPKGCLRSAIGCMRSIKMKLNITIPSTGSSGSKIVRIR